MSRKKKPKWPPVLFVIPKTTKSTWWSGSSMARKARWFCQGDEGLVEPYISLTRINELLATRGVDPIKIVEDNAEAHG